MRLISIAMAFAMGLVAIPSVASLPATIRDGTFRTGDNAVVLDQEQDTLWVLDRARLLEYRRAADGTFRNVDNASYGVRIVDRETVEMFRSVEPGSGPDPVKRLVREFAPAVLKPGKYSQISDTPTGHWFAYELHGDKLLQAYSNFVNAYQRQDDDAFVGQMGKLRIVADDTVVFWDSYGRVFAFRWTAETPPGLFARARAAQAETERMMNSRDTTYDGYAEASSGGDLGTRVLGAFAGGYTDAARDNAQMRDDYDAAIARGIATGALERERREQENAYADAGYTAADVEHARQVRESEEAARQARAGEARAAEARRAQAEQQVATASGGADAHGGDPSTATDPMTCVTTPATRPLRYGNNAMEASVENRCDTHVDIVLCLQNASGWRCGVRMGVAPGGRMVHELDNADGQTFMDARTMGSTRPLGRP